MPISSNCPMCGHNWQTPDNSKGRQVRCPECYQVYTMPGTPEPAVQRTGASHAGTPKRAATNGSYAGTPVARTGASSQGTPVVRPGTSSQGNKPVARPGTPSHAGTSQRPSTAGSQAGNQAIRGSADTPAPFTAPTIPPAPVPHTAAPEKRSGGGASFVIGILFVLFLMVGLAGAGIVGLMYLKKSVDTTDNAQAKANDAAPPKADEAPNGKPNPEGEKKPAPENKSSNAEKKPSNAEKKPTDQPKSDPKPAPREPVKPAEKKPAAREGALVNVLQGPAVLGDGELTVVSAGVGSVQAKDVDPNAKYFIVRLSLRNTNKTNGLDFFGWGVADPINDKVVPRLIDSMGNSLPRVTFPVGVVLDGQTLAQTIQPEKSATDVLCFAVPSSETLYLKLILGGPSDRTKGTFRLLIPASKLTVGAPPPMPKPLPPIVKDPAPKPPMPVPVALPPEIVAILKGLQSPKPEDRLAVLTKLGEMKADAAPAVPELAKHLQDENEAFRLALIKTLGLIGPKAAPAVPELTRQLTAERMAPLRVEVARTLGLIGPGAAAALDTLRIALQDTDPEVVVQVREAIKLISADK